MTKWKTFKFGDVVRQIKDRVTDIENSGLTEYTRGEHIESENLHLVGRSKLGDGQHGSAFHMRIKPGDVLYVSRNPHLRKVAVADYEGICANTTYVLRADGENLIQELLPFIMQTESFVEYTVMHKRGSTNFYLNFSDIEPYEFPLPPVDEQRRIADLLWAADDAIETKKEAIDNLLAVKKSAIAEKMRLKRSLQSELPNGWEMQQMGKYLPAGSIKNGLYKPNSAYGSGTKIIRIDSFQNGEAIEIEMLKQIKATKDEIETFSVYQDDVLVNRVNSMSHLGKTTIVPELSEPTLFESNMMCLRFNPENALLPRYAWYLISSDEGRKQLVSRAKKAIAQASVNQEDVKSLTFPIPTIAIQKEILDLIADIENTISLAFENLDKTIALQHEFRESFLRL
jgi:type I restriction enzyme S subunit